jgi:PAS domain S-box-containing protein
MMTRMERNPPTPLSPDEDGRRKALLSPEILDSQPEQEFDDLTGLACQICGTPIGVISLGGENRQWFKAKVGLTADETARDAALCAHGILQVDVMVINDTRADERFAHNPLVTGEPGIRFYAGAPLITSDGQALGMLCVNDYVPRTLNGAQVRALHTLSRLAIARIESRLSLAELRQSVTAVEGAKEELQGKTAFFEAMLHSSLDGILVVDEQRRLTLQNQKFFDLLKFPQELANSADDEEQLKWFQGMTKNPGEFMEKVAYLYAHPQETSHDEIELKDGRTLDRSSAPVVGKDGKQHGRIWSFRDITERKQLEKHLTQSQKLEMIGKLTGGIAHEFNSIMTTIIGQSELLLIDLPANDPLRENAQGLREAADRAAALTRQLLAYGRKQILLPKILDLNTVLKGMEPMLRHLLGKDSIVRIVPGMGLKPVKVDAGQIEQVIMNLAMNAADAMPEGGKLTLETTNVTLDQEYVSRFPEIKAGEYVMLGITDTGAGMSEEVKARVFEPFFSTKDVGQGTGLGLAACYGIVKQSGGHISVSSEPARGSTFRIYLPQIAPLPQAPASGTKFSELPRGKETILLAEDDPVLREMAARLLQGLGYTVLTASDGAEAVNLFSDAGRIDLLFTDVVMPKMGGKELSDRIRAQFPSVRILFTSAYTQTEIVKGGISGVALLQKPFTPGALARKVRETLDGPLIEPTK